MLGWISEMKHQVFDEWLSLKLAMVNSVHSVKNLEKLQIYDTLLVPRLHLVLRLLGEKMVRGL